MLTPTYPKEPWFIIKPEDQFIVKGKPAYLVCVAKNASEVLFKCNGLWLGKNTYHSITDNRDPNTEIKYFFSLFSCL